ncbi:UPF0147 family protein [Candidatus Micrarchaeota archaeon]|nr:UPF0147 family protein [Candidatus Micrarchaeota archaeon]
MTTTTVIADFSEVISMGNEEVTVIAELIDSLIADGSVPKNVRAALQAAKDRLTTNEDIATGASGAIYALDEVSNDINLPMHARTMIWNILSELETIKKKR